MTDDEFLLHATRMKNDTLEGMLMLIQALQRKYPNIEDGAIIVPFLAGAAVAAARCSCDDEKSLLVMNACIKASISGLLETWKEIGKLAVREESNERRAGNGGG